ncbi:MAG: cobalt-precorrin 5A hydrolase [Tissierellia bacterium]|nr:cobalt-precorrin 5A hydrolase [Tissierellia bacterium]
MNMGILSFSKKGFLLAKKIEEEMRREGWHAGAHRCKEGELKEWTEEHFKTDKAIVFIGSCGIAVRAIAPFLKDKTRDPAVIVIDETGTFAVSLLSGHMGGANRLTQHLSEKFGSIAVITTATDRNRVFSVDGWAEEKGLFIVNSEKVKKVSSQLLCGKQLALQSDFPIEGDLPENIVLSEKGADILISNRTGNSQTLQVVVPIVTLGIGCRKGVAQDQIDNAFRQLLEKMRLHEKSICQICSIDLKKEEPGLVAFSQSRGLPFHCYSAQELKKVEGEVSSSPFVESVTGVDNVCERSALLGAGEGAFLIKRKESYNGITMALAAKPYIVRFKEEK